MREPARVPEAIGRELVSSKAYAEWDRLQAQLAVLRREVPLGVVNVDGYDPFWAVTRHADIQEIGRHPDVFHTGGYRAGLLSQAGEKQMRAAKSGVPPIRSLVAMDPPEHRPYRMLTFGAFAPKGIRGLEDEIRVIARETIDEMAAHGGECEFVRDVALLYPLRVIMSLMGLPRSDEATMLQLTQEYFNPQDPELNTSGQEVEDNQASSTAHEVLAKFIGFFDELTANRRRMPTDDIASVIANSVIDGKPIRNWEATSYYVTIATAGHDTTSSSTAGGIWALATRPDQLARVRADPSLIPGLVDESIRWTTPILHFMRTAKQDYELRGQSIRAGDWMMLSYLSANRDEEVFADPAEFRMDRSPNPHLAFGFGPHVCLGQHLAKMEMRIFFEELLPRLESVALNGKAERTRSVFVGGVKRVPIRFKMTAT
ncbi:cytochrome P450 [Phenylobacterium sp.]|uniref:cytochrome P450 n=1 Tax=Phenylobacterium sp. TaxID=1871053 RepID=UPI0025DD712C|nr:cytochrome P450 [Phenylobacterium sp.]